MLDTEKGICKTQVSKKSSLLIQVVQAPKLAIYKGFIDPVEPSFNVTENYSEILV